MLSTLAKLKQTAENAVQDHLYKERTIPIPDSVINMLLEKNLDKISDMSGVRFTELQLKTKPENPTLFGSVNKLGVTARFFIDIQLLTPIWESDNHSICLTAQANNLKIERAGMKAVLASVGLAIADALSGGNALTKKLKGLQNAPGVIEIPLDGLDDKLDLVISQMNLKALVPGDGKIEVIAKVKDGAFNIFNL